MILQDIQDKLKEIDENVFYGMVHKKMQETVWNYIVFNRKSLKFNENKTSCSEVISVHVIRENFIPEELVIEVIKKMQEIAGVKVTSEGNYEQIEKPNTNILVEMFSIDFVKVKKV